MMYPQTTDSCESVNACRKVCGENKSNQKNTPDKNCDTTTRCNTSSCCFVYQYLPAEETNCKNGWSESLKQIPPHYTERPVSGYLSDCWQPPEVLFI